MVDLFGSLTGEMAIGYSNASIRIRRCRTSTAPIADGALIWQATALTTAKLTATSQVYETTVDGASGEFSRDVNLEVDHAFRTWLIGILKLGYGTDRLCRLGAHRQSLFLSRSAPIYKFTREMQIRTRVAGGLADRYRARQLLHGDVDPARPALAALT